MVKKIFEAEYDDDLYMADAADGSNRKLGVLFDDDSPGIKGHAKFRELDEDELRSRYADEYSYESRYEKEDDFEYEFELSEEQRELAEALGTMLGAFAVELIRQATPHVKKWWGETFVPGVKERVATVSKAVSRKGDKKKPRKKKGKKRDKATTTAIEAAVTQEPALFVDPKMLSTQLDEAYAEYKESMTSKEAGKTLVEAMILASMLAERIKRLSNAEIADPENANAYLDWQEMVEKLTGQDMVDSINHVLEGDVQLFDESMLANFSVILGRDLYNEGLYVPIDANELKNRLMPGLPELPEPDDDEGEAEVLG